MIYLTLSWRSFLSYRNQSIDLFCKSMNWFLYDRGLRHERINGLLSKSKLFEQIFFKIGVPKNFAILSGNHLCLSIFLIRFFRPFLTEHLRWLLLESPQTLHSSKSFKFFDYTLFFLATLLYAMPSWNWQKIKQIVINTLRLNFPAGI